MFLQWASATLSARRYRQYWIGYVVNAAIAIQKKRKTIMGEVATPAGHQPLHQPFVFLFAPHVPASLPDAKKPNAKEPESRLFDRGYEILKQWGNTSTSAPPRRGSA